MKYLQYIKEFHNNNQVEVYFVNNQLSKHLKENEENQTEIEHILDYLYSNPKIDISKIWYITIKEKAEKRNNKLQSIKIKDDSDWIDIVLDFKDWFKFVKLRSKESYKKEWKLMSHCVASYYWKWKDIYSLRDWNNNPHCTIEDWNQIKGKGNGKIDPKYIDYVVKFLEFNGMKVREEEMANLWYYKLDKIDTWLTCEKMYNWYVFEWNLHLLKDCEWNKYRWLWILNIKNLIEFDVDLKFKINLNIKSAVEYCVYVWSKLSKQQDVSNKDSAKLASSGYYIQLASSGYYTQLASSGNSAQLASSGNYTQLASSGDYTQLASSGDYTQLASSGNYTQLASSGNYTQLDIQWQNSIGANIWYWWLIKWVIWTWITLAEYKKDEKWNYIPYYVKSVQIDWKKVKENVWYKLENKKLVEVKID